MNKTKIMAFFVTAIVASSVIAVGMSSTVSAGQYEFDEPTVSSYIDGDNTIDSGETKTFNIQVMNKGDNVVENDNGLRDLQSAYSVYDTKPGELEGVELNFEDDNTKFDVKADKIGLNSISSGVSSNQQVRIESSEDLEPGRYNIPVEVEYTYVFSVFTSNDDYLIRKDTATEDMNIEINVEQSGDLEITDQESVGLYENSEGQVRINFRNSGSETAEDVTIQMMESQNIRPTTNSVNLGTLDPGESSDSVFQASVSDVSRDGNYSVGFKMQYEGNNGQTEHTDTKYTSVRVEEGPKYEVETVESELYVDSVGRVEVNVTNNGGSEVEDARIKLQSDEQFTTISSSGWLGTLDTGESSSTTFKLDVSDRAAPETYPIGFVVEHSDRNNNLVQSEVLTSEVEVGEEKRFDVENVAEVSVGSTETVTYTVKNTGSSELREATVRINSNSPFETDDDTNYVGTLQPNETQEVKYKISTEGSATVNKTYSLDTTIKYKNSYGDTVTTDTVSAPIEVTPNNSIPVIPIIAVVGVIGSVIAGAVIYRRR